MYFYFSLVSISQAIGCQDRFRNDVNYVWTGVKLYSLSYYFFVCLLDFSEHQSIIITHNKLMANPILHIAACVRI